MTIEYSPASGTVVLQSPRSSYAFRIDREQGTVRPVHWGPRLSLAAAEATPAWITPQGDTFEGPLDGAEELPVDGGRRFGPVGVIAHFPDGTLGLELSVADPRVDGDHVVVALTDTHQPLTVELHYRLRPDTDVVERWSVLRHTGDSGVITVDRHDAAQFCLPARENFRISYTTGAWSAEGRLHRDTLPYADTVLAGRRGVTGHQHGPWAMLDDGTATEDSGDVWSASLAFSGSWRITATRTRLGRCALLGGAGQDGVTARLQPGEELVSPVFAGVWTADGFGAASRAWHDYQRKHVLPHPEELRPVLYNSWEATVFDVTYEGQLALARKAADLGVEMFVVDDGWFGARTSDAAGLGDWTPNPQRFPDGLGPLAAEVRKLGMSFGLWVEPEMVNPDSDLYREHPDWVMHTPGHRRTEIRNQLVLDFARPEIRDWAFDLLDALVRDNDLDFLKWDYNRPFTEAPENAWIGHAAGLYEVIDRLRAKHPELRIESCSSGGGRVDLGILARTDQTWTSDNTDAVDRLTIQDGYTQLFAPGTMMAWVTDSPNPLTRRLVPLRFRFHVAMAGSLGIGGNLTEWSEDELREAADFIEIYRDIRPVVQHGALYRLRPPTAATSAVQYVAGDRTVVFVWRPSAEWAPHLRSLPLRGIDPDADYRDDETGTVYPGGALVGAGLPLDLPNGDHASALIRLTRVR